MCYIWIKLAIGWRVYIVCSNKGNMYHSSGAPTCLKPDEVWRYWPLDSSHFVAVCGAFACVCVCVCVREMITVHVAGLYCVCVLLCVSVSVSE